MAELFGRPGGLLIVAAWPRLDRELVDAEAEAELGWLVRLIGAIRAPAASSNVPPGARLTLHQQGAAPATWRWLERHRDAIQRLARRRDRPRGAGVPPQSLVVVVDEATFALPVGEVDRPCCRAGPPRARDRQADAEIDAAGRSWQHRLRTRGPRRGSRAAARAAGEAEATRERLRQALRRID